MRIGLLGGTFDPVHNGHLQLATQARAALSLDKIIFIPAFIPPHKEGKNITPSHIRLEMLRLALQEYPEIEISEYEIHQEKKVYTIDTVRFFIAHYPPQTEIYFLAGSDALDEFNTWKESEKLLDMCTLVIAKRPGFERAMLLESMHALPGIFLNISSSEIRQRIREGQSVDAFVPSVVLEYFKQKSVYEK